METNYFTDPEFKEPGEKKKKSFFLGVLIGVCVTTLVLCTFFICFIFGMEAGARDSRINVTRDKDTSTSSASNSGGETDPKSGETKNNPDGPADEDFSYKAGEIYKLINEVFYFEDNIDTSLMQEKMYAAMLDALNDPYSTYYTVEEWESETEDSSGTYYGIGSYVTIDEKTQYPMLSGVFDGSPASKAGLRNGDIIYEVNGENVGGYALTDVVKLIRGPENTDVTLTIIRDGKDNLTVVVTRGKVNTISVESDVKRGNIGYIQIKEFSEVAEPQFKEALADLKSKNVGGIIIDLRGNGGGNLSTVLNICEELLPKGLITYLEYKDGQRQEFTCSGKHEIDIPMVVLVNGYSASASELMTGALRDHKKATIIGTTTYGKGIAQSLYPFTDGTAVKLTTASYFTPNGECVHKKGITPDIELEFDSEKYYDEENPVDNQLEYAIDYLLR
ncbi:MAG: S41 family peptidase [Lachnospiraceae bacterium]|nr:S41 family peptidase [Lachnospiraceae bacterium]